MEKETPTQHSKFPRLKITLKVFGKDGSTSTYHSSKTKRIFSILKHGNFSQCHLKVSYGKHLDVSGALVEFYNDGNCTNKEELLFALRAFSDKSLVDYLRR